MSSAIWAIMNLYNFEAAMQVYSQLKLFHFPEKINSLTKETPITAPLHIRWKPTNKCNHRCHYCSYHQAHLQLGQDMREQDETPRDKALEIANDIADMGVKAVTFSGGGEPLVYPHLLAISKILCDGGVKLATLTNGSLLKGEKADFLAHNAVWVRVSMDGWDDTSYTKYRSVKSGEYSRIMRNMEAFVALGGSCTLGVSLIIDKENYKHLIPALIRLKNTGVSSVKVSACVVSNDAKANNAYHAPYYNGMRDTISKAQADLSDNKFEIVNAWHTLDDTFDQNYTWCPYSQIQPIIGADLRVYPCHDKAYNLSAALANLEDISFKNFWENNKNLFFQIVPSKDCKHHCTANIINKMVIEYFNLNPEHKMFV